MTTRLQVDAETIVRQWVDISNSAPVSRLTLVKQIIAASRFKAPATTGSRTLVLASAVDKLVDPRCSRVLAERLGAPIRVHPTSGHDIPLDDPQWVCDQVGTWLDSA